MIGSDETTKIEVSLVHEQRAAAKLRLGLEVAKHGSGARATGVVQYPGERTGSHDHGSREVLRRFVYLELRSLSAGDAVIGVHIVVCVDHPAGLRLRPVE